MNSKQFASLNKLHAEQLVRSESADQHLNVQGFIVAVGLGCVRCAKDMRLNIGVISLMVLAQEDERGFHRCALRDTPAHLEVPDQ